ncbi:MAG: hypothetical protein ACYC61_22605 [Isosphaeraceae bacterium]
MLIALFLPTEGSPGLADGQRTRTASRERGLVAGISTTEHTEHTEKDTDEDEADPASSSFRVFRVFRVFRGSIPESTSHSWSSLPIAAGSVVTVSTADRKSFNHELHERHESDRSSQPYPSCHPWLGRRIVAGSVVVRVGRNAPAEPVFRVSTALTPGKTQNEPNFGGFSGFVAAAKPASAHPRDRSRGPPIPQIAAISTARPPPGCPSTVPC